MIDTLDTVILTEDDQPIWRVQARGEVYGPYTLEQVRTYVRQGRIKRTTAIVAGDGDWVRAGELIDLVPVFDERDTVVPPPRPGNFVVFLNASDAARVSVLEALSAAGPFAETLPNVFLLRSRHSVAELRVLLTEHLANTDQILVVDATKDRLAWSGLGPEGDREVRSVWGAVL